MGRDNSRELRRRSDGILPHRRQPVTWRNNLPFRILSLDGGGIKGIFPAAVLAFLEQEHLQGGSIGDYFDLIAGTSTGGILALGLGAGLSATEMLEMYLEEGHRVFSLEAAGILGQGQAMGVGPIRPASPG